MFKRSAVPFTLVPVAALLAMLLLAAPAAAAPALEASPASVEFGAIDRHFGSTQQQNVKFTNNTAEPLLVIVDGLAGADASRFQIVGDSCSASFVGPGENCSVDVAFQPSVRGSFAAKLLLDTSQGVVEAPVSASAVTGTPVASPSQLTFSPIPFNPPGSFEGESNESQSLSVQNSSDAGTQIESVSISGPDAKDFSVEWGNCENDLMGPSNSCGLGIRFRPSATGVRTATLTLDDDSAAGPIVVPLSGEGLRGPKLTLDTTQALLGNVPLGSSTQHTFTVTNGGDYPLYIQRAFLVTGTPLMFPVLSDSCSGQIVQPGESCAIALGFSPTTIGEKDASLLFITNTPAITVAGLDGVGVPANEAATVQPPMPKTTSGHAAPAPAAAPALAIAAAVSDAQAPALPPTLTALRPPRLYSLLGRATLDPGADVQCPASAAQGCEALGFIVPADYAHGAPAGFGGSSALLGSALVQLRGGQGMHVRIPLSARAAKRLKRHRHMLLRVGVVVQSAGAIVAQHSWTVQLSSTGAVSRL
jgi:hypothetical protein